MNFIIMKIMRIFCKNKKNNRMLFIMIFALVLLVYYSTLHISWPVPGLLRPVTVLSNNDDEVMIVVTGASENHADGLIGNFLTSVRRYTNPFLTRVIVYDLGLTSKRAFIQENYPEITFRKFNFSRFPKHVYNSSNPNGPLRSYAFKPIIIYETALEHRGKVVVWIDGDATLTGGFDQLYKTIKKIKVWTKKSSRNLKRYTHPGMFKYFNVSRRKYGKYPNSNAGICGFDTSSETVMTRYLLKWYKCALVQKCIIPNGSSRRNHRQDQAALSVILTINGYRFGPRNHKHNIQHQPKGKYKQGAKDFSRYFQNPPKSFSIVLFTVIDSDFRAGLASTILLPSIRSNRGLNYNIKILIFFTKDVQAKLKKIILNTFPEVIHHEEGSSILKNVKKISFLLFFIKENFPKSVAFYLESHTYMQPKPNYEGILSQNQELIFPCYEENINQSFEKRKSLNETYNLSIVGMDFRSESVTKHILLPWFECESGKQSLQCFYGNDTLMDKSYGYQFIKKEGLHCSPSLKDYFLMGTNNSKYKLQMCRNKLKPF